MMHLGASYDWEDFGRFLEGNDYDNHLISMKLKANTEYFIDVTPTGHITTDELKALSFEDRQCNIKEEVPTSHTFISKNQQNCFYDCLVSLSKKQCKCLPWDFVSGFEDNLQVKIA